MSVDIIGRELVVDDFVVCYNNIYQILSISTGSVRMILANKSPSTRPIVKLAREVTLLPKEDVLMWVLKRNAK